MNGDETMGSLYVLTRPESQDSDGDDEVFEVSGSQGIAWQAGNVRIPARQSAYKIIFEVETGYSYRSDIAIDDIEIRVCDTK